MRRGKKRGRLLKEKKEKDSLRYCVRYIRTDVPVGGKREREREEKVKRMAGRE